MGADDPNALAAVEFEVYGQVQGISTNYLQNVKHKCITV